MNVVTRGMRNAFRNITRTVSIVSILGLSIGLSLVMFIANQAVEQKIKTTLASIGTTIQVQPAGYSGANSINNALTNSQLEAVRKIQHIKKVSGTLTGSLQTEGTTSNPIAPGDDSNSQSKATGPAADATSTTNLVSPFKLDCQGGKCVSGNMGFNTAGGGPAPTLPSNFSLPIRVVGTNAPTDPAVIDSSNIKIVSGAAFDDYKDVDEAMISSDMATKNNLKVGDTFTAYKKTLKVTAIFTSDTRSGNSTILVPLAALQRYTNQKDMITGAVATVDSLEHLDAATKATQAKLGSSADVTSPIDEANKAIEPLRSVKDISLYSLFGAVGAAAIIILLTMVMIVRERKREIGVLKAIGFGNLRIMLQFMCEALTLAVFAAGIGLAVGVAGGNPVTSTLVKNTSGGADAGIGFEEQALNSIRNVQATVGWEVVAFGLGAAIIIALLGSALASFFIAKIRPAEVLRSE